MIILQDSRVIKVVAVRGSEMWEKYYMGLRIGIRKRESKAKEEPCILKWVALPIR